MRCQKVRRILRYHVPKKLLSPEKFPQHVMLLFFPFRDEKQLYQNKLQEQGVPDVVNRSKIKFEPYDGLVYQAFSRCNENSINNHDPHRQTENDETPGAEYSTENDSEDTEAIKTSTIPNLCHRYYHMMKSEKA